MEASAIWDVLIEEIEAESREYPRRCKPSLPWSELSNASLEAVRWAARGDAPGLDLGGWTWLADT